MGWCCGSTLSILAFQSRLLHIRYIDHQRFTHANQYKSASGDKLFSIMTASLMTSILLSAGLSFKS